MQTIPIEQYGELLDKKHEKLTALFAPFNAPALEVFASPPQHYRMRAEFRLWHDDGDLYHIMFTNTHANVIGWMIFPLQTN